MNSSIPATPDEFENPGNEAQAVKKKKSKSKKFDTPAAVREALVEVYENQKNGAVEPKEANARIYNLNSILDVDKKIAELSIVPGEILLLKKSFDLTLHENYMTMAHLVRDHTPEKYNLITEKFHSKSKESRLKVEAGIKAFQKRLKSKAGMSVEIDQNQDDEHILADLKRFITALSPQAREEIEEFVLARDYDLCDISSKAQCKEKVQ